MWARVISAAIGIWLIASPGVLDLDAAARSNGVIVGAVAASSAIISIWEATRPVRWVNLPLGLWLIAAPWTMGFGVDLTPAANSTIVGVLIAVLATVGGHVESRFGGGWSSLWNGSEQEN